MRVNFKNIHGKLVRASYIYRVEDNTYLPNLTLSKTTLYYKYSTKGHKHDGIDEIYFFLHGKGEITIGERTYPAESGDVFLIKGGEFHQVRNPHTWDLIFLSVFQKYDREQLK